MSGIKRCLAVVLAGIMLLGATACGAGNTQWALRADDLEVSPGVYIFGQINAFGEAQNILAAKQVLATSAPTLDEVLKADIEGKSGKDWINEKALNYAKQYLAAEKQFAEKGLSLSPEVTAEVESSVSYMWEANEDLYTKSGVSKESLRKYLTNQYKRGEIFTASDIAFTDEEIKEYFTKEYAKIKYIDFALPAEGEEGYEEKMAAVRADVERYKARVEAGENFEQLIFENTKEYYESTGSTTEAKLAEEGEYDLLFSRSQAVQYGQNFGPAAFDLEIGAVSVVEEKAFIYIIKRISPLDKPEELENYRQTLVSAMNNDAFQKLLDEWVAGMTFTTNDAALKKYTPNKLKIS
ncbi:hypothetical protein U6B65_11955 [Oscillospiraceae bacterium MB08-C2-2]|nr:hypothetical protein U6B65_11955 [Oscillospiraceae bacterium MB08-C2-2]